MLLDTLLEADEFFGVGRGRFVVVPDMGVDDGGTRLEGLMGGFHLFRHGDRDGGVVGLFRQGAGDGNADDAGFGHAGARMKSCSTRKKGLSKPASVMAAGSVIFWKVVSRLSFTPKTASEVM